MRKLWFYMVCWKHRNDTRFEFFEQYTLILKAARRCAYDMNHCASDLSMANSQTGKKSLFDYHEMSQMWQELFSPTGGKDYRHRLHLNAWELESEIKRLKRLCADNNIDSTDPDGIPF